MWGGWFGGEGKYNGRVVIHLRNKISQRDVLLGGLARLGQSGWFVAFAFFGGERVRCAVRGAVELHLKVHIEVGCGIEGVVGGVGRRLGG